MNRPIRAALAAVLFAAAAVVACGGSEPKPPEPGAVTTPTAEQRQSQQEHAEPVGQEQAQQPDQTETEQTEPPQAQQPDQTETEQTETEQAQQQEEPAQEEPSAPPPPASGDVELALEPALNGYVFEQPTDMATLDDGSWLVAEQRGSITRFVADGGEVEQFGVLDISGQVVFSGERGLLSVALHPDLASQPYIYVYYSPKDADVSRLSRFAIAPDGSRADRGSELVIIEIPQPYTNHNGGAVRFGPDGMLYLGIGDGGAANDPQGHGQNRETLLGSIIRIDVSRSSASEPYRIPTDNPFIGVAGVRPEIWAYGLRNPWRMAFDPLSGLLWVGDVGQNRVEEIAVVEAGDNHGWNVFEGDECFRSDDRCAALSDAVAPLATYGHDEGCSVTGGMVYRGQALPHLVGAYIFGDYCSGTIWGLWPDDAVETGWARDVVRESDSLIASFAVDDAGEIYVLTFNGPILKLVQAVKE